MIRQNLLVLVLMVAGLSGCCLSASHQSSGCHSCGTHGSSCGLHQGHSTSKCGCRSGSSCGKTAPLFPGDSWDQGSMGNSCSDGSCGPSDCSSCGASMSHMPMPSPMPESMNSGCGCGEQSSAMMPMQQFSAPAVQPQRATSPSGNQKAPMVPPESGMPPKPYDTEEPSFPIEVDPETDGAPAAAPVIDPVSWNIPAIPQSATPRTQIR